MKTVTVDVYEISWYSNLHKTKKYIYAVAKNNSNVSDELNRQVEEIKKPRRALFSSLEPEQATWRYWRKMNITGLWDISEIVGEANNISIITLNAWYN